MKKTGGQTGTVKKSCFRTKFGQNTTLIQDAAAGQNVATGSISQYQISNQNDDANDTFNKYVAVNNAGNMKT